MGVIDAIMQKKEISEPFEDYWIRENVIAMVFIGGRDSGMDLSEKN